LSVSPEVLWLTSDLNEPQALKAAWEMDRSVKSPRSVAAISVLTISAAVAAAQTTNVHMMASAALEVAAEVGVLKPPKTPGTAAIAGISVPRAPTAKGVLASVSHHVSGGRLTVVVIVLILPVIHTTVDGAAMYVHRARAASKDIATSLVAPKGKPTAGASASISTGIA
jgi:hypothetical protein